jgi:hypothetical protein
MFISNMFSKIRQSRSFNNLLTFLITPDSLEAGKARTSSASSTATTVDLSSEEGDNQEVVAVDVVEEEVFAENVDELELAATTDKKGATESSSQLQQQQPVASVPQTVDEVSDPAVGSTGEKLVI